jgi:hypothetical protein
VNDHSASRRVDILREEAPHLLLRLTSAPARVEDARAALKAALANARVEHTETGTLDESTWNLLDLLAEQLGDRFGELEAAERKAGLR